MTIMSRIKRKWTMDYPIQIVGLVDSEYENELASIALATGKSKKLILVTKILPGGSIGIWFKVKFIDRSKKDQFCEIVSTSSRACEKGTRSCVVEHNGAEKLWTTWPLEAALERYNEILVE